MPELPEVEVIRRELNELILGDVINSADLFSPGVIGYPSEENFCLQIMGRKIESTLRKGKFLIFILNGSLKLVIHLRMTGTLTHVRDIINLREKKYLRATLNLKSGEKVCFSDVRKFGRMWILRPGEDHHAGLDRLGPDWWSEATPGDFINRLALRSKSPIKTLLLDQRFMAGLGNIYTDESLFRAGIHPATRAGYLNKSDALNLFMVVRDTLSEGIDRGGTSFRDYRNASGKPGGFQEKLLVYQRKGELCGFCDDIIQRTILAGRGTYFCPTCQQFQKWEDRSRKQE